MSKQPIEIPKRVLYVHHGSGQGGAANSLLYLLQNIDRARYEPIVACDFDTRGTKSFFSEHGFPPVHLPIAQFVHMTRVWRLQSPRDLAKLAQWALLKNRSSKQAFRRLTTSQQPDLVHLNSLSIVTLAPIAQRLGIPAVLHVRESVNDGNLGFRKRWLARLSSNCNHIVYICQDNRERLTGIATNTSVVYNPIELRKFEPRSRAAARQDLGLSGDAPLLFFPGGSLFDVKGIVPFLKALVRIRETCDGRALIPGLDTPPHPRNRERKEIEQIIGEFELGEAVIRVPFTNDVETYYAACDVVVAPFIRPHFSRAVIEAGAMFRPVVGSRIGGITEVLEDGVVGLLSEPDDHTDLFEKIRTLIENPSLAEAMGKAGREVAIRRFGAVDHGRSIMRIYDSVVGVREVDE